MITMFSSRYTTITGAEKSVLISYRPNLLKYLYVITMLLLLLFAAVIYFQGTGRVIQILIYTSFLIFTAKTLLKNCYLYPINICSNKITYGKIFAKNSQMILPDHKTTITTLYKDNRIFLEVKKNDIKLFSIIIFIDNEQQERDFDKVRKIFLDLNFIYAQSNASSISQG